MIQTAKYAVLSPFYFGDVFESSTFCAVLSRAAGLHGTAEQAQPVTIAKIVGRRSLDQSALRREHKPVARKDTKSHEESQAFGFWRLFVDLHYSRHIFFFSILRSGIQAGFQMRNVVSMAAMLAALASL